MQPQRGWLRVRLSSRREDAPAGELVLLFKVLSSCHTCHLSAECTVTLTSAVREALPLEMSALPGMSPSRRVYLLNLLAPKMFATNL